MAKRRAKPKPKPGAGAASVLLRSEVIGTILVVLAVFILLSLLSAPANGALTGALVDGMRTLTGGGRWLVPVLLGALGVWLILRKVSEEQVFSGRRAAAAVLLFLVIEVVRRSARAISGRNDRAGWPPGAPCRSQFERYARHPGDGGVAHLAGWRGRRGPAWTELARPAGARGHVPPTAARHAGSAGRAAHQQPATAFGAQRNALAALVAAPDRDQRLRHA